MTNKRCADCKYWDRDSINDTASTNGLIIYRAECLNPINPGIVPICYTKLHVWHNDGEHCPCFEPI
jgi:hypothetical protein